MAKRRRQSNSAAAAPVRGGNHSGRHTGHGAGDDAAALGGDHKASPPTGNLAWAVRRLREHAADSRDTRLALEELEVYQEEVRQQNEQLIEIQRSLEESRDRYADLYDFAPIGYVTLDYNGVITEMNLTATVLFNYERERMLRMPLVAFVTAESRQEFLSHVSRCRRGIFSVATEVKIAPRGGPPIPVQLSSRHGPDLPVGGRAFRTAITPLTELRKKDVELEAYRQRLRTLTAELALTEQRERQIIATELHDNLGQVLALARIKLGTLAKGLRAIGREQEVKEITDLVAEAIRQTRSLTVELSPPVLQSLGLEAALEWLGERNRQHGLEVRVTAVPQHVVISEDLKIFIFQAVRELLNNVVKHAHATRATVYLRVRRERIDVMVEDNGTGFHEAAGNPEVADRGGFGLFSIRTRVEHLGGSMTIEQVPSGGTRVLLLLPGGGAHGEAVGGDGNNV